MPRSTKPLRAPRRSLAAVLAVAIGLVAALTTAAPASAAAVFDGFVRDQAGAPVIGIAVEIWYGPTNTHVETVSTNSIGRYSSSVLGGGPYAYVIADGSQDSATNAYGLSTGTLASGGTDIPVKRYTTVSGTIANWSAALGGVNVTLWENESSAWIVGNSVLSTDGTFTISSTINTNPYTLQFDVVAANAPLLSAFLRGEEDPVAFDPEDAAAIPGVAGTPLSDVETYLPEASTITGTVTTNDGATALAGIDVWLEDGAGSFFAETVTAADGTYTLYARPNGAYLIGAEDPTGTYGPMWYDGWDGCGCALAFTPVYAPDSGIDFDLRAASTPPSTLEILGGVGDLNNDPLSEIEVRLFRASGATWVLAKTISSYDFGFFLVNFGFVIDDLPVAYRVQFVDADGDILMVHDGATTPDFTDARPPRSAPRLLRQPWNGLDRHTGTRVRRP